MGLGARNGLRAHRRPLLSPRGDVRPGWRIILDAFLAAPDRTLTNIELGDVRGVQAFRSRISDLRAMGCDITEGTYVCQGVYRYRLVQWPVHILAGGGVAVVETIAAAQDQAAEAPQLFADDAPAPASALTADF